MTEQTTKTAKNKPLSQLKKQQNKIDDLEKQVSFMRNQLVQINLYLIKLNKPVIERSLNGLEVSYRNIVNH